jgi:hypothetical protein
MFCYKNSMSRTNKEKGRTIRSISAASAAGAILSLVLGAANILGAKLDGEDIATQQNYNARRAAERAAYQLELDRETPEGYTMNGVRLVPKAAYAVSYPQEAITPMELSQEQHRRTGRTLLQVSGLATTLAAGAALMARRQRKTYELAAKRAALATADTGIFYYVKRPTIDEVAALSLPPTEPRLHGTPVPPTFSERRAAQLAISQGPYDPFAMSFNHAAVGLTVPETPHSQPIIAQPA